jgi:hypothetical protein
VSPHRDRRPLEGARACSQHAKCPGYLPGYGQWSTSHLLYGHGVRVNAISVPPRSTDWFGPASGGAGPIWANLPMLCLGSLPDEVSYVTAATFMVDGGFPA